MTIFALATGFWASYVLLWVVVLVFGVLIVLLFRQFGLTFMRSADRASMQGLDVGSRAPDLSLTDTRGHKHHVRFAADPKAAQQTLIIFALPTCEICADLATTVASLPAERPQTRFVWVDGTSPNPPHRAIDDTRGWISGSAPDDAIHRRWDVSAVPFCFVVGADGRITNKRLINRREELDLALGIAPDRGLGATPSLVRS